MTIKLGSNIASISAQRRLGDASFELSKTFERLASGQRINRASDDAAGLAIADDLNAKSRVYTQAIRNGNDGISLLNIADSTVEALNSVVVRIRELSEQAATGTYSNKQRAALDAEAQALSKEFARITQTTSFNGLKIFDGSLASGLRLQLGYGSSESINASIGGAVGTAEFLSQDSYRTDSNISNSVELADLNSDGFLDLITSGVDDSNHGSMTIRLGAGNGTFGAARSYTAEGSFTMAHAIADANADGILDLVSVGTNSAGRASAGVRLGLGNGTFGDISSYTMEGTHSRDVKLGDLNGDGLLDLITTGYLASNTGYASVRLGVGNGNFGNLTVYSSETLRSFGLELGDLNADGILDLVTAGFNLNGRGYATVRLGVGDGTFGSATQYPTDSLGSQDLSLGDLNGDGILDLVTAGYGQVYGEFSVRLGNGNGSFGSVTKFSTQEMNSSAVELGDVNGDGILDVVTSGMDGSLYGFSSIRVGLGNGNFGDQILFTADAIFSSDIELGDINGDGVLDLVTAGYDNLGSGSATVRLARTEEGLGAILEFSLKTRTNALQSMSVMDKTIENLAKQRGIIGASQSRVNIAIQNLQTARENFKTAESRIRDADVAEEAGTLIRTQILQQAAASVLSQANQSPSLALQLLS